MLKAYLSFFRSFSCFYCREDPDSWTGRLSAPVLPFCYLSFTPNNSDFRIQLSALICQAERERTTSRQCKPTSLEVTHQGSPDSGGSYFEMGLDHSEEIMGCTSSSSSFQDREPEDAERAGFHLNSAMWCHCIVVTQDGGLSQRTACVAADDSLLVVFQTRSKEPPNNLQALMDGLEIGLVVPFSDIEAFHFDIPDTCVSLKVRSCDKRWYFFSDSQSLKEMHFHVDSLVSRTPGGHPNGSSNTQLFIHQFLNSWEIDENESGVRNGLLAHVLDRSLFLSPMQELMNSSRQSSVPSDILSTLHESHTSVPLVLFLTTRHLCILKLDLVALASKEVNEGNRMRSCAKLTRIPLAMALLNPKQGCTDQTSSMAHSFCNGHVLELMAGHDHLVIVFALPHDKFLFLRQFNQFRASLRDIKTIALLQASKSHLRANCSTLRETTQRMKNKR